jgi:sulfur-oxidizing protein SoxA
MRPGWQCRDGGRAGALSISAALALTLLLGRVLAAEPDPRRTGFDFMSPALQALQRDDTQNPALLWVQEGAALWARPAANGKACATCHAEGSQRGMAARHPRIDERSGRPLTLAARIDQCRQTHQGEAAQGADGAEVLALGAYLAMASRGMPLAPDSDPRMAPWVERGQRLWQQRMGQLDLSCANCHDQNAGRRLGGAAIPQAHPTGYPSYRLEWQTLGSLPRRLRSCLAGVRAEPFAPGADEWLALEAYLAQRASGLALEGPSVRP